MVSSVEGQSYGIDDPRVVYFEQNVGPQVRDYLQKYYPKKLITIAPIGSGGKLFALRLKAYLDSEGIRTRLFEIDNIRAMEKMLTECKRYVKGSVLIGVDDAIWTGKTYRAWKKIVSKIKGKLKIVADKLAVEHDNMGLSDWSCKEVAQEVT